MPFASPWSAVMTTAGLATMISIAGCQSYEPRPLDLESHRERVEIRSSDTGSIESFLDELRAQAKPVPSRFDLSDGLSRAEGEVLALMYNPDLRIARAEAGVALATLEHAGLWDDPEFGFDGAEILSSSAPFEFGVMLALTLPVSGRLDAEKVRAGAAHEAALRRIMDHEWTVRCAVRATWASWSRAEAQVDLLHEIIAGIERIVSVTDRLQDVGELNRTQARLFRVEHAERRAELRAAEHEARQRRAELLQLMGLAAHVAVNLEPELVVEALDRSADHVQQMIESNTSLAVQRAEYATAEAALRVEIRAQYPDVTFGSGYGDEGDDRLLLGVSMPLPFVNANRGGIAEARARREVSRAAAEVTFERLTHELAQATSDLESARAQREIYESEVVPMLAEQAADVQRITTLGEVDTLLLLDDVSRQLKAKSRLLELQLAEAHAANRIVRILGPHRASNAAPNGDGGES